jgi:putative oxidoreductase
MQLLAKFQDQTYAFMRIAAGFMLAFHGPQILFGMMSTLPQAPVGSQIWVGGIIELLCGLFVLVGFKTRWSAFLASGTMAVAYAQFHWKLQLGAHFFPAVNQGELALLYAFVFLFIASRGGVTWCVDKI